MTHAVEGRSRRGGLAAGVLGVALASALTLGGSEEATAQTAGPNLGLCEDRAWQNLNNCYMAGSGSFYDFMCALKFEMDLAQCGVKAGREIWGTSN